MAPSTSILGSADRDTNMRAQAGGHRTVSWAGIMYMSMLDMISDLMGKGAETVTAPFITLLHAVGMMPVKTA
jgi:hypothetical protein